MSHQSNLTTGLHQRILDNLGHAVLMFDSELRLVFINPAGEMLFAISTSRLLGQLAEKILPAEGYLLSALRRGLASGHPITEYEVQLSLPGRQGLTVDCTVTPLATRPDDSGLLVEIRPLDHQRRVAREEQQIARQQTFRTLVRGLAHEIKNPLGGLRGAAQLLERELPSAELKEYTHIIIGEADRLRNLVDHLLGPNTIAHKAPLNIHQVLEHVRQLVQAELPAEISLCSDYDPSIPEVNGDRDQLIQAVLNVVGNAVQALGKGGHDGENGRITLRTRARRQFTIGTRQHRLVCQVCVIDNGPGIPEDLQENIFFPMVTGRADGTGLGLSIAQSLINQHDGLITCKSRPGRTQFCLLLPLVQDSDAPDIEKTTLSQRQAT